MNDLKHDSLLARLKTKYDRAVERESSYVCELSRRLAPVRSGFLRDSHEEVGLVGPQQAKFVVKAPYAGYVNDGTEHMAAQPFYTQAKTDARQSGAQRIASDLRGY